MGGFKINIERVTLKKFRNLLCTDKHSQLVLMSLRPKEEIGMETHPKNDQFFRFEEGQGKVIIDGNGKLRDELLNRGIFDTLLEEKVIVGRWKEEYNTIRPRSLLNYRHPAPEAIKSGNAFTLP